MDFKGIYGKDSFMLKTVEEQQEYFNIIHETFNKDKSTVIDKLNLLFKEAHNNNIAVLDYIGMLYFGDGAGIDSNLYFATCLCLYAAANGSKLATARIRTLLQPAYDYVISNIDKVSLYDIYNLKDNTFEDFILAHIASTLIFELKYSLTDILEMHKNLQEYPEYKVLDLEDLRDEKLAKFVDYLGL